jgi:thiol-disulfide isomerase/thioredoxin
MGHMGSYGSYRITETRIFSMYKKLLLAAFASLFFISCFSQTTAGADAVLQAAYKQAAKEKKNVIVIFHASWCVWCRKMDISLNDPAIKQYFDKNYVIAHLTVQETPDKKNLENPGAEEFMNAQGGKDQGLPYWIVMDNKGNKLADSQNAEGNNMGCPAAEKEVAHFIGVLQNTSGIKENELSLIAARFRKNE